MVIEGTATETQPNFADDAMDVIGGRPSTQTPAGAPRMPEDGPDPVELIDPDAVMPMTASRTCRMHGASSCSDNAYDSSDGVR